MKIAVIGAGAWGTTLSILLANNGHEVTLWVYEKELARQMQKSRENKQFLPGFQLPANINITTSGKDLTSQEICFFVVPTQHLRSVARQLQSQIDPKAYIVCASKGIEQKTYYLPLDILHEVLHNRYYLALSGPNLSKEIAEGLPAATVVASSYRKASQKVQKALMSKNFRVYTNDDDLGVQIAGALKNVIAIAAGICDGLKLGNNAKSAILIRGISEITRLGVALGAKPKTFAGLSGMGDLITTCGSQLSRNHQVGEQLAKGKKLKDIQAAMKAVAEGVPTTQAAVELSKRYDLSLPITEEIYQILFKNKNPQRAIADLMAREAKR
ncbi:MAG: NAD(P)H-dependent glycerol-3-phosphate dehydrogenase, partial [bacterium]